MDKERGIKVTYLHAGEFKAAGQPPFRFIRPMTGTTCKTAWISITAFCGGRFQLGRGISAQAVRDTKAKVLLADEALEAGLIDRLGNLDQYLTHFKEQVEMTLSELKAQHPELGLPDPGPGHRRHGVPG
jgi:hypothetical protein